MKWDIEIKLFTVILKPLCAFTAEGLQNNGARWRQKLEREKSNGSEWRILGQPRFQEATCIWQVDI